MSSFVVAGREGMPLQPGGVLPSPLYAVGQMSVQREPGSDADRRVVGQELPRIALDGGCGK